METKTRHSALFMRTVEFIYLLILSYHPIRSKHTAVSLSVLHKQNKWLI